MKRTTTTTNKNKTTKAEDSRIGGVCQLFNAAFSDDSDNSETMYFSERGTESSFCINDDFSGDLIDYIPYSTGGSMEGIFKYLTERLTPYVRRGYLPMEKELDLIAANMEARMQKYRETGMTPAVIAAIRQAATLVREARETYDKISHLEFEKEVANWSKLTLSELEAALATFDKANDLHYSITGQGVSAPDSAHSLRKAIEREKRRQQEAANAVLEDISMEEVLGPGTHHRA